MLLFNLEVWLQVTDKRLEHLIPHRIGGKFGIGAPCVPAAASEYQTCVMIVR
jgi:hypothetical protein